MVRFGIIIKWEMFVFHNPCKVIIRRWIVDHRSGQMELASPNVLFDLTFKVQTAVFKFVISQMCKVGIDRSSEIRMTAHAFVLELIPHVEVIHVQMRLNQLVVEDLVKHFGIPLGRQGLVWIPKVPIVMIVTDGDAGCDLWSQFFRMLRPLFYSIGFENLFEETRADATECHLL